MNIDEYRKMCNKSQRRKPREEEHRIQCACVRWFKSAHPDMKHNLFAVPNAGNRSPRTGAWYKDEGLLPGVADLILLKSNRFYGALLVEMKTPAKNSRQSESQKEWERHITRDGYKYIVCRSLQEFIHEVTEYLKNI